MTTTTNLQIKATDIDNYDVDDIVSAKVTVDGREYDDVKVYDDAFGQWYLFGHEFGPVWLIRADSFQSAWEIAIDESPTIDVDDIHEAYDMSKDEFEAKSHAERNEDGDWPDLVEGYEYQSNATGSGIVNVGHFLVSASRECSELGYLYLA